MKEFQELKKNMYISGNTLNRLFKKNEKRYKVKTTRNSKLPLKSLTISTL